MPYKRRSGYSANSYSLRSGYSIPAGGVDPHWDNLLAGYLMDETNDLTHYVTRADVQGDYNLTDSTDPQNAGNGGCPHAAGVNGNAAHCYATGTNDTRYLKQASGPSIAGIDFFLAVWMKSNVSPNRTNMSSNYTTPTQAWSLTLVGSPFTYLTFTYNGQSATDTTQWAARGTTTFHLVCIWFDSSDGRVRMQIDNGTVLTSPSTTTAISGTFTNMIIGHTNYVTQSNAYYDGLYLFSEIKDSTWRTDHWNGGAGRVWPD